MLPASVVLAAHELKHPLILIRQLALSLDESDASQAAERIRHTAEQALRLTNNVTRQARLEDSLFETETCDAYALCHEVAREIAPLYQAHDLEMRIKRVRHRQAPMVVANADLLRRVLMTFAENALQYADDKSTIQLSVQLREKDSAVRFLLRDFGPTMPLHFWRRMRENITRGELLPATSQRPLSSGLGLAIAQTFARHMQGEVGVVRHRDGMTFFVDMPLSRQMRLL